VEHLIDILAAKGDSLTAELYRGYYIRIELTQVGRVAVRKHLKAKLEESVTAGARWDMGLDAVCGSPRRDDQ